MLRATALDLKLFPLYCPKHTFSSSFLSWKNQHFASDSFLCSILANYNKLTKKLVANPYASCEKLPLSFWPIHMHVLINLHTVFAIIQFLKVMYLILTLQVPLTLLSAFSQTISVFSKKTLRSVYSIIHALRLVSASKTPWECTVGYKL